MARRRPLAVYAAALAFCALSTATTPRAPTPSLTPCIWDSDTIDDELRGVPDALDLLTGRSPQHGEAYYRARLERLTTDDGSPSFADLDDVAVARERLGNPARAIEVMHRKGEALDALGDAAPTDARYRYHANLGTFLAHSGRFEDALAELERAVTIDPNAHFGRETVQIELIRSMLMQRRATEAGEEPPHSFVDHTLERGLDLDAVVAGLEGMVRFGGRPGAILFTALGETHQRRGDRNLAWFAFQRALECGAEREGPRGIALRLDLLDHQITDPDAASADDYAYIRANADGWLAAFHAHERRALARGADPGDPIVLEHLVAEADRSVPRLRRIASGPEAFWQRVFELRAADRATVFFLLAGVLIVLLLIDRRQKLARRSAAG